MPQNLVLSRENRARISHRLQQIVPEAHHRMPNPSIQEVTFPSLQSPLVLRRPALGLSPVPLPMLPVNIGVRDTSELEKRAKDQHHCRPIRPLRLPHQTICPDKARQVKADLTSGSYCTHRPIAHLIRSRINTDIEAISCLLFAN